MKIRLQIIGFGSMLFAAILLATGAIALHSDTAIISGGIGFVTGALLKTIGDLLKN